MAERPAAGIDRRAVLAGAGALAASPALAAAPALSANPPADPFVGTGGVGHTTPAATLPWGMVQLGPDTDTGRWAVCSGYHADDGSILGFSHTHLSGTGIGDLLDVLVVPGRGTVVLAPGTLADPDAGYRQRFANEAARPGWYAVQLANGVAVELTATARVGLHRYRFPPGPGHLLVDLAHASNEPDARANPVREAWLAVGGAGALTGGRVVDKWARGRQIHFALETRPAPDRVELFVDDRPAAGPNARGKSVKAVLHFAAPGTVEVKTGLSAVGAQGARAALAAEAADWRFDAHRRAAAARWEGELGRVRVEGGTERERAIFASALYHALLAPTLFTDRDGRYRALDGEVRTASAASPAFSTYSLWDTYRALHPLLTLAWPERAAAFARDLVRQTVESPTGPPVWTLQGVETHCMIGWHSVAVLAEATAKGLDADYAAAWPVLRRRAFEPPAQTHESTHGLPRYLERGWIPADETNEAVSRTVEYGYDDHAAAVLAEKLGHRADAARLRARARGWRTLYDPATGFLRPKLANGAWAEPFDPAATGHSRRWRDYTEANAWQATFMLQHDLAGLMGAMGGDRAFVDRLDGLFGATFAVRGDVSPDITGNIGQYVHGNEPSHHVAYLYSCAGAPWRTAERVRAVMAKLYGPGRDGLCGNDDCGQMSAWYVLSALGLYPVDPVSGVWVVGSPLFTRAELAVAGGTLVIEAPGNGPDTPYVQALAWNGRPWPRTWLPHALLARGGRLGFTMGPRPHPVFGTAKAARPPV